MTAEAHTSAASGEGTGGAQAPIARRPGATPTLEDAIREGLSPKEALRLSLRVSEAVAARHARGIVHGQLTPRSIHLERGGHVTIVEPTEVETKVLYRLRYASPEVARREEAGTAADVFSLSLIVRELIEGIPARRGEGEQVALEAVDGRVSMPHGLTGELQALVAHAVSPHPESRPSAPEFVAALKGATQFRGFTRQEWVIAAVALLTVLMLAVMLKRSAAERDLTTRQFEDSRAAVEGLLSGIYPELDRVKDVAPLAKAGERALSALMLVREAESTPETDALLARALLWNGEAQRRLGASERAVEHFGAAVEIAAAREAKDLDVDVRIPALLGLAEIAAAGKVRERAEGLLDQAIELGNDVADPSRELALALARAHLDRGQLAMAVAGPGRERARAAYAKARSLLGASPKDLRDRDVLALRARASRLAATLAELTEDHAGAVDVLEEHVDLGRRLVDLDPGSVEMRRLFAAGENALGRARMVHGEYPSAVEALRGAAEGWRLLAEMDPENVRWRNEWARSTRALAESLDRIGESQEATTLHDLSLAHFEGMFEAGVNNIWVRLELIQHCLIAAEGLLAAGDLRRARERLDRAGALLADRELETRDRDSRMKFLALFDVLSAELLLAEARWDPAEKAAQRFFDRYQAGLGTKRVEELRTWRVRSMLVTAAIRAASGKRDEATEIRERALGIARGLVEQREDDITALALLARTYFELGRDAEAAGVLAKLDAAGYRGLELSAVRAATAQLRRR